MVTTDGSDLRQTTVFKRTLTPYWNETFELFVPYLLSSSLPTHPLLSAVRDSSSIQIQIFDQRKFKRNDQGCLGSVSITVGDVLNPAQSGHGIVLFSLSLVQSFS